MVLRCPVSSALRPLLSSGVGSPTFSPGLLSVCFGARGPGGCWVVVLRSPLCRVLPCCPLVGTVAFSGGAACPLFLVNVCLCCSLLWWNRVFFWRQGPSLSFWHPLHGPSLARPLGCFGGHVCCGVKGLAVVLLVGYRICWHFGRPLGAVCPSLMVWQGVCGGR